MINKNQETSDFFAPSSIFQILCENHTFINKIVFYNEELVYIINDKRILA